MDISDTPCSSLIVKRSLLFTGEIKTAYLLKIFEF
ncbi:MAG: hypothetical protein ACI9L9_002643 [Marivirga sp.]